jgi:hypothetical protein
MRRDSRYIIKSTGVQKKEDVVRQFNLQKDEAILTIVEDILRCATKEHVDSAVMFARALHMEGINPNNYILYFLFLETNNSYVIDQLIGKKNEFNLFSPIKPNWFMLKRTFEILYKFKQVELYRRCVLSLLGIIQNTYKESKYGFNIYKLSVSDVYNIGKYLDKKADQIDRVNRLILDILLDIYQLGTQNGYQSEKNVAMKANEIRMAYFDSRKTLSDVIPDVLLLGSGGKTREIKPSISLTGRATTKK